MLQTPTAPLTPNERALANRYRDQFTGKTGTTLTLTNVPAATVDNVGLEQVYKNGVLLDPAGSATTGGGAATRERWAHLAGSVSSITRVGSTASVTLVGTAPFMKTGDQVAISGATQTEYNGTFVVTVIDSSHFTYTVTGTPATPATGTITWAQFTVQLAASYGGPDLLSKDGSIQDPGDPVSGGGVYTITSGGPAVLTFVFAPIATDVFVFLYFGGAGGSGSAGYSIQGNTITFGAALVASDKVVVDYPYRNN